MTEINFYCSVLTEDGVIEEGEHGEVDEIVLEDAYFSAGEISNHMPNDEFVSERDVEGVRFTIDVSGERITEDDVSSHASRYLNKFPGIYEGVANFVESLDFVPAETFTCPDCGNFITSESNIGE